MRRKRPRWEDDEHVIESNGTFITAAYTVTWVVVLAYFARLMIASARARAEYAKRVGTSGDQPR